MRPLKSEEGSMPESMIATPMPLPVGLVDVRPSVARRISVPLPPEPGAANALTAS